MKLEESEKRSNEQTKLEEKEEEGKTRHSKCTMLSFDVSLQRLSLSQDDTEKEEEESERERAFRKIPLDSNQELEKSQDKIF